MRTSTFCPVRVRFRRRTPRATAPRPKSPQTLARVGLGRRARPGVRAGLGVPGVRARQPVSELVIENKWGRECPPGHEALPEVTVHPLHDALGFRIPWRQLPDLAAQHAGERRRRVRQPALADPRLVVPEQLLRHCRPPAPMTASRPTDQRSCGSAAFWPGCIRRTRSSSPTPEVCPPARAAAAHREIINRTASPDPVHGPTGPPDPAYIGTKATNLVPEQGCRARPADAFSQYRGRHRRRLNQQGTHLRRSSI